MSTNNVPQVDINAPLPISQEVVVDTVMVKAKREWRAGIVAFCVFVMTLGIIGYYYNTQIIRQSKNSESQTTQIISEPEKTPMPTALQSASLPVFAVWNGSGVAGAAGKLADKLKAKGYEVVETKNAPEEQVGTTVEINEELKDQEITEILNAIGLKNVTISHSRSVILEYSVKVIIGQ